MGLTVSGLTDFDSASVVSQLMVVERAAGTKLTTAKTSAANISSALTTVNGLFKTMQTAAEGLVPDSITKLSGWTSTSAKSSDDTAATVTSAGTAKAGSLTFTVNSVASAGSVISGTKYAATDVLNGGAAFSLSITTHSGTDTATTTSVSIPANAKMADVAAAINDADLGVAATMVQTETGKYQLQVASEASGANSNIAIASSALGDFATLATGADTVLHVGAADAGFDITSTNKTVSNVLPGVDITAVKADATKSVTISVASDTDAISDKVQALVDAANNALSTIKSASSYDADTKKGGVLNGDSTTRDLTYRLQSIFSGSVGSSPTLAGVSIDKDGVVTFDSAAFATAYAKDPAAVESTLTKTATSIVELGKQATNSTDGLLTLAIAGEQKLVDDYADQIEAFDVKMTAKEVALTRQYSALETLLNKLNSQNDWLTSQLDSLSTSSD